MNNLTQIINYFTSLGMKLIPLLGAVAFLVFIWGIVKFIRASSSGKDLKDSKSLLIWGVIGMFVMVTIWGIIRFISIELDLGTGVPVIPQIHF